MIPPGPVFVDSPTPGAKESWRLLGEAATLMIITIGHFRSRVQDDCAGLVAELQNLTGRYGPEEAQAWQNSLSSLSRVFQAPSFQPLHLYFGSRGHLALEYQLPASSSWCDVVLLGSHESTPSAVILELKDWNTRGDKPGRFEGLIERQGRQELHPSDQVRGYTHYCRRFHSTVADQSAAVHGCVLSTRGRWTPAYSAAPNNQLVSSFPLFSSASEDANLRFPAFFRDRLTTPDEAFANAFEDVFVAPTSHEPPKKVIIITGPPGSGESVIAARLWGSLVTDPALPDGDVVFTTTSLSQNSNWSLLFDRAGGQTGARGVVRKATAYSPISTHELKQLRLRRGSHFLASSNAWRENLATLRAVTGRFRDGARDNQHLIAIVDEAHALINPEDPRVRGQFGFPTSLGPQAYHIIRTSLLTIFLLDPQQGFRQRENTSLEDIREWSRELGAGDPEEISLEGLQFRCAGSAEFVAWLEAFLQIPRSPALSTARDELAVAEVPRVYRVSTFHRAVPQDRSRMDLRIFDNPEQLEAALRERHLKGDTVRLLSSFSRPWKTHGDAVEETGVIELIRRARREARSATSDGRATSQLLQRVVQAYRILFTRALKGVFVWVPDAETRAHLAASIRER
jgi:hypothetical protein